VGLFAAGKFFSPAQKDRLVTDRPSGSADMIHPAGGCRDSRKDLISRTSRGKTNRREGVECQQNRGKQTSPVKIQPVSNKGKPKNQPVGRRERKGHPYQHVKRRVEKPRWNARGQAQSQQVMVLEKETRPEKPTWVESQRQQSARKVGKWDPGRVRNDSNGIRPLKGCRHHAEVAGTKGMTSYCEGLRRPLGRSGTGCNGGPLKEEEARSQERSRNEDRTPTILTEHTAN